MPREIVLRLPPSEAPPGLDEGELRALVARELGVAPDSFAAVRATRVSFDARRRHFGWRVALRAWASGEEVPAAPATTPSVPPAPPADAPHVVVVGSGPAGLFCALELLSSGLRVSVLERGRDVRERRRSIRALLRGEPADPESNYCFGEGGAGTYSDGKLYARSGRKSEVRAVLETLVAHGAPSGILASWRPHIGSNRLPDVVAAMRASILAGGGAVRFGCRAEELRRDPRGSRVASVVVRELDSGETSELACDAVVLATGHSALDALEMARDAGARLEPKGFAMGGRIEHPQDWLDERQYRGARDACDLPAAFYELSTQVDDRGVYAFCMCPGGFIVPATTSPERLVVNGMSLSRRDSPFANSGLVVSIEPEDWCGARGAAWGWSAFLEAAGLGGELPERPEDAPLFGVRLQHALEIVAARAGGGRNRAPSQRADLVAGRSSASGASASAGTLATSYRPGLTAVAAERFLPEGILVRIAEALDAFDRRIPGYASDTGQLVGVETRTSSPVRLARDPETCESVGLPGLYPCGEGAGFAGGIVSAAIDGRRVARSLALTHAWGRRRSARNRPRGRPGLALGSPRRES